MPLSDCEPWTGCRNEKGYGIGTARDSSGSRMAHRVAYESAYGRIPEGMRVLHSCDNPPCVNPAHLRAGTPADNTADMVARGRGVAPTGLRNGRAKLSDDAVAAIRVRHHLGESNKSIARSLGLHPSYVGRLVRGVRR